MAEYTREFFKVHAKSVKLLMKQHTRRSNKRESFTVAPKGDKVGYVAHIMAGREVNMLALGVVGVETENGFDFKIGVFF